MTKTEGCNNFNEICLKNKGCVFDIQNILFERPKCK